MANFYNAGMATSNPQANVAGVTQGQTINPIQQQNVNGVQQASQSNNGISPITIPIQIQPQIAGSQPQTIQPNQNLQVGNQNVSTAPTPQIYQGNQQNTNTVDFNQIYKGYQSQYGNTYNADGSKQSSIGTTIVMPTTQNLNTVEGQYQSAWADTANSIISQMITRLNEGFSYDPTQDNALRVASEYAANSTLQSLAGSGVLNSSATAERVARIVSELIPTYENLAHDRWLEGLSQLASTAQLVMNYDSQQFQYWADAKDREFQEKQFEYQKRQDDLNNAWKRVDELGYVDNEASAILGVEVGTLSKDAREAKEAYERQLELMYKQAQVEYENNVALARLKSELDLNNSRVMADYQANIDRQTYSYKASVDLENSKVLSAYNEGLSRETSAINANRNLQNEKDYYSYQLQEQAKYNTGSSANTTSLSTHDEVIKNNWVEYDENTHKYTLKDNAAAYNYIKKENQAGRMSDNDAQALISKYGITAETIKVQKRGNTYYVINNGKYYTYTTNSKTTKQQIIDWGKREVGVDLSQYL